jgi:hypothetical protein
MKYIKLFEQFAHDSGSDKLIDLAKECLDLLKHKIIYKELFDQDPNSWFLAVFCDRAPISRKDFRMLSQKYMIQIKDLSDDVLNRFFKEQTDIWPNTRDEEDAVYEFTKWWGWHYDDIYNLGNYEKIKPGHLFNGSIFTGTTSPYESDLTFYVKYLDVSKWWDPEWINVN